MTLWMCVCKLAGLPAGSPETLPVVPVLAILALFLVSAVSCTPGERDDGESGSELRRVSYMSSATGEERDFFVYLPEGYGDAGDSGPAGWPVILFLHGNGERGDCKDELDYVMIHRWLSRKHGQTVCRPD